jgi:hypothetical protein
VFDGGNINLENLNSLKASREQYLFRYL